MLARVAAIYAIFVGVSMVGVWSLLFVAHEERAIAATDFSLVFHIVAEGFTAFLLVAGGLHLLRDYAKGRKWFLYGMGLLTYSLLTVGSHHLEAGKWPMVALFAALLAANVFFTLALLRDDEPQGEAR